MTPTHPQVLAVAASATASQFADSDSPRPARDPNNNPNKRESQNEPRRRGAAATRRGSSGQPDRALGAAATVRARSVPRRRRDASEVSAPPRRGDRFRGIATRHPRRRRDIRAAPAASPRYPRGTRGVAASHLDRISRLHRPCCGSIGSGMGASRPRRESGREPDIPRTGRVAAAAASWIFRGRVASRPRPPAGYSEGGSRRRRGRQLDIPRTGRGRQSDNSEPRFGGRSATRPRRR